jgi:hypothetical protein
MEKKIKKEKKKVEYFTDEMAKNIFPFQPTYKGARNGKPIMGTITKPTNSR